MRPRPGVLLVLLTPAAVAACSAARNDEPTGAVRRGLPPPRVVPIPDSCRGSHLSASEAMLADATWACACHDPKYGSFDGGVPYTVRAGDWCGLPHENEGRAGSLSVSVQRTTLAPGEGTRVLVRMANPGATAATYRMTTRHLQVEWVAPDGQPLPRTMFSSGSYPDEAMFELESGGAMEITLDAPGTRSVWDGDGEDAGVVTQPLAPGRYALRVALGGLGGEVVRLLPVEVR